jgi:glycosyltransferase involved in cell wall biosynthesis
MNAESSPRPLNICHVITRLIIGGAQENTVLTCRGLHEKGHRVTLIAGPETGPEGSLWDQARSIGCEVIALDSLRRAVRPLDDWRARRELVRLFRRIRPDVIHTHSSKAGIVGRSAAFAAGVPIIIHTIHGMSFKRTQSRWVQAAYRMMERRAARHTHGIITVADAMIEQAVAAGIAPRERFVTIRSGLEVERFAPCAESRRRHRSEWGVDDDEVVVGTIARLFVNKGYEEIIAAMSSAVAREPRLRFVWIGDGADRSRYERELVRLGLRDRVTLAGLVRPERVASMINGFDILLHASRWEGLPRAVVQGLLAEVPAISFDNDGAPEVVLPERTGILVRFGDVGGLSDAMAALARDAKKRRELGRCGRAHCLDLYDWWRMVDDIERLYRRIGKQAGHGGLADPGFQI